MPRLLFDAKLKRPGCVLLAAVAGTDFNIVKRFHAETWLVFPTPDMKVYEVTAEQLNQLVEYVNKRGVPK